jgi:hypothetical protein
MGLEGDTSVVIDDDTLANLGDATLAEHLLRFFPKRDE